MIIHVVQLGDTLTSIAESYGIPIDSLIINNGIQNPNNLIEGQCIVIVYPQVTYIVQEGDTLAGIASVNNTSIIELLRNNPFLSDREFLYPGETLVIRYGDKKGKITTNGYANPFIDMAVLRKTLPFLTFLTIFGYRLTRNADVIEPDDEEILQLTRAYKVAPLMLISSLSFEGVGSEEDVYHILFSEENVKRYAANILAVLKRKGFYGVSFILSYITGDIVGIYNRFAKIMAESLNSEGYAVFISISPVTDIENNVIAFERIDYSEIAKEATQMVIMNYNWGYYFGPPTPVASISTLQLFIDYLITLIPRDKMNIGLPVIGYSWLLPYLIGITRANAITYDAAIELALTTGSKIQFDEISQNPHFEYYLGVEIPRKYVVWFVDARTIDALLDLVIINNFPGISIWNIMTYFTQLWLVINSQYDIETIID
ncbi:LysM peptidoglycan-binding domain-containing protein [Anaerocolumna sp. AGMB13020]|uniref:LysM peptidoglycan-binding domain-containing protein n=1 Tax=Anaerocolumna sp. AGMB13020 TaxID=3081750 RepID=UPI002954E438|nr:LysM peptidoglycan-binding domain-containing protein [Anaerocolumna sp. AGMB13020]WOO37075.1 LysM peptidoglycan-binding domain-containing protein [Anaerocolumna sp. AGMB13020]